MDSILLGLVVILGASALIVRANYCVNSNSFVMTHTNRTSLAHADFRDCLGAALVNVSFNNISELKNNTFDVTWNIQVLDLSYNNLHEIPDHVFKVMRNLKFLNLSNNHLDTLPLTFFENKQNLIAVDLSHNLITHIPLPVFNYTMTSILEVNIQHNKLVAFEPWAFGHQPIRVLDLRFNNISTFTNDYNWTYTSRTIYDSASTDLRNNSIVTWHDWYLMQYKTGAGTIESAMVELLTDIRDNPLHCDCNMYNTVKTMSNSFYLYNGNPYIEVTCHGPPELQGKRIYFDILLNEFVCNLTSACPAGCLCQERPHEGVLSIDCVGAGLTEIPATIPESSISNVVLNLANNSIQTLKNVSYLDRVITLILRDNNVESLPNRFVQSIANHDTAYIDLRNNKLTSIPESTQNIKFENAKFSGNNLECDCDMIPWMVNWIKLAPNYLYEEKTLHCTFEGNFHKIIDLTEDLLKCHLNMGIIVMIVILCVVLVVVVALFITAWRCPYETKVMLFKIFRVHPADHYKVDGLDDMTYDVCVAFDEKDDYVRQWVMKVLFKQLEEKKPFYRLCTYLRNGLPGSESESRLDLFEKSRRLIIILSHNFENRRWNDYDLCHAERLENNDGRVIFILYDKVAIENSTKEPLKSKLKERKVFSVKDRMLWSKLRYEMPPQPCPEQPKHKPNEFDNLDFEV